MILPARHWCSVHPPHSLEMGLKAGTSFHLRLLGIEEGTVNPECEGLISFSSTGTELDSNGSRRKDLFLDL